MDLKLKMNSGVKMKAGFLCKDGFEGQMGLW